MSLEVLLQWSRRRAPMETGKVVDLAVKLFSLQWSVIIDGHVSAAGDAPAR